MLIVYRTKRTHPTTVCSKVETYSIYKNCFWITCAPRQKVRNAVTMLLWVSTHSANTTGKSSPNSHPFGKYRKIFWETLFTVHSNPMSLLCKPDFEWGGHSYTRLRARKDLPVINQHVCPLRLSHFSRPTKRWKSEAVALQSYLLIGLVCCFGLPAKFWHFVNVGLVSHWRAHYLQNYRLHPTNDPTASPSARPTHSPTVYWVFFLRVGVFHCNTIVEVSR